MCDIPDYKVKEHIQKKKTLRVFFPPDLFMDLTPKQLRKPLKKSELFRSKWYADQTYRLYSYHWKPQRVPSAEELFKKYVY